MVVETQILPFLEWLLGPNWHPGTLWFWLAAAGLAAAVIVLLGLATRQGAAWAPRLAGRLLLAGALLCSAVGGLLIWYGFLAASDVESLSGVRLLVFRVGGFVADGAARPLGADWWSQGALYVWLLMASMLLLAAVAVGWFAAALRSGPLAAVRTVDWGLSIGFLELARISPRRVWGLSRLAVKESIRRRIVVAFAVFILVLLFAGWFLDTGSTDPARLYLGFVLSWTGYLVLLLALFLSAFSLPADISSKTLHTVVTKPVRSSEIVLGRIVGFTIIGTGLLVVMGAVSYLFVVRGLRHEHELDVDVVAQARAAAGKDADTAGVDVVTSQVRKHRHPVHVDPDGTPTLGMANGHWHDIEVEQVDGETVYRIGPARGALLARVPVYGKLRFLDRKGQPAEKGINVGDEWTYRSYIEGGTSGAAIWTFEGITEEKFPEGLPVEMTLGVFRTHKGKIEKGIAGSLSVRNPETGLRRTAAIFTAEELKIDTHFIPRTLTSSIRGERDVDLFQDIVVDGRLEIVLRCLDKQQFYGAAQPDLYLRARDASFELNFVKGYVGIWLQMVLVIGLGVTFSTFLSGPVAMLATAGTLLGGFFSDFMYRLATGQTYGGGPTESLVRLVTQQNVVSEMEPGARTTMAKMMDMVLTPPLWVMSKLLPPFDDFSFAAPVAYGFDISPDMVISSTVRAFGFLFPVFVAGYFFLKTREVAK